MKVFASLCVMVAMILGQIVVFRIIPSGDIVSLCLYSIGCVLGWLAIPMKVVSEM